MSKSVQSKLEFSVPKLEVFDFDEFDDDLASSTYRTLSRANSSVHTVRPYQQSINIR